MKSRIASKLLRWYGFRRRSLPWRERPRPYAVWVAEIMAQQTRLEAMLPYYRRWMRRFPTVKSLAAASEHDVLALWEGLGYYSRARNLLRAAQMVMTEHGGKLPSTLEGLLSLPGIGRYTAGAIGSLAFGIDAPAVDGNAIRVLARVFAVREPMNSSIAQKTFWALATEHLPSGKAAEYNQALMDLGAKVCTPRNPKCETCPLRSECQAHKLGIQESLPVRGKSKAIPVRFYAAAILRKKKTVLVLQRADKGLLAGLWEFPNVEVANGGRAKSTLQRSIKKQLGLVSKVDQFLGEYEHAYSHFEARLQAFAFDLNGDKLKVIAQRHRWVAIGKLNELPMGKLDRSIANTLRHTVG